MVRKSFFDKVDLEANPIGWSFAFEISIKAQLLGFKIGEVPVVSVDRPFGGQSTFKLGPWIKEYLRWFFWGIKRLNRFNRIQKRPIRLEQKVKT